MTDRELLQYAAKAAGLGLEWCEAWKCMAKLCADETFAHNSQWHPLVDDGDAFRLAVTLRLCALWQYNGFLVYSSDDYAREDDLSDPYAAVRRAITRVAAEVGRNMR